MATLYYEPCGCWIQSIPRAYARGTFKEGLDNETKKQFNFFYLYYLLIDIALLESAIKKGENKLFRSGEMTDGEMKSIIRRNFLQSLQVVK